MRAEGLKACRIVCIGSSSSLGTDRRLAVSRVAAVRLHRRAAPKSLTLCPHGPLPLLEEELLGAEHGAWARDAQVANHFCAGETVVLHQVHAYQGAGAAEASLAVHGDEAGVSFGQVEELADDLLRWYTAVNEVPARIMSQFCVTGTRFSRTFRRA